MADKAIRILVTGGTGLLGRAVVNRALSSGHPVTVLSRTAQPVTDGVEYATGDLASGPGAIPLDGVGAVVHCATTNGRRDEDLTRNLVDAVRAMDPQPHLVYISIVGIDDVPFPYYRAKLACEKVIEGSGDRWTILRATQFHDLIERILSVQDRMPVVLVPRRVPDQPIDVGTVADRLVELAEGSPAGHVEDIGGPEVRRFAQLAEVYLRARGSRRRIVGLPVPGAFGRALRDGKLTTPDRRAGTTFAEHVASRWP
ncbi:SDR family oxidoreductase [Tsukamurella sp. 8F]|uniref:SDR family oxidoreductase n=1 Tax=unclassified Tsukamurella TaxID=2633480 RepID=UPI0023B8B719|nr:MULTISPECIES: SDR family oxidoreductase [unclassified Tsukamurella]MDF0529645.1 SDR family oxidoreductase [Tsukamurella sp. 8J]MDF0585930.1 SDR family oxidoreductase [Tsukamurella sp. 8F]